MFCSGCGQPISPGQQFCLRCGRQVPAPAGMPGVPVAGGVPYAAAPPVAYFYSRVHRHLQAMGILWIAYGAWTLFQWAIAMSFFSGIFGNYFGHWNHGPFGEFPMMHLPWFAPLITIIVVARTLLSVVTGIALVRRAPWGRMLALVTAFLTLIKPITGTALAIYTLWALLPAASAREYEQMALTEPVR
jgi:hypothetical protein